MSVPLNITVTNPHQVISFPHTCNLHTELALLLPCPVCPYYLSQAALLHPGHHHWCRASHTQPVALVILLGECCSPWRGPVILGREHGLRSKGVEEVKYLVRGERGTGEGELELGGWSDWWRLQQLLELIFFIHLLIHYKRSVMKVF